MTCTNAPEAAALVVRHYQTTPQGFAVWFGVGRDFVGVEYPLKTDDCLVPQNVQPLALANKPRRDILLL